MSKNFTNNAEKNSIFLVSSDEPANKKKLGDRNQTKPLRSARSIPISRIKPDPKQPRKTFNQTTLESLAESIKEFDGIVDPLTVEYVEGDDCFIILSGERRYRAAKIVGLTELPCVIREVDDNNRFLLQLLLNLQREDIPPLEEAAGIRYLLQQHGFTQQKLALLLNKSKSYVSQILGLERLSKKAKEKVQTSEIPKEVQIKASREKEPEKQLEIIKKATEERKTVRQIRKEAVAGRSDNKNSLSSNKHDTTDETYSEWFWESHDGNFSVKINFKKERALIKRTEEIKKVLEITLKQLS